MDYQKQAIWEYIKEKFNESLTKASYETWIETAEVIELTQDILVVTVPTDFHKNRWQKTIGPNAVKFIHDFTGYEVSVTVYTTEEYKTLDPSQEMNPSLSPVSHHLQNTAGADLNDKYTFETFVIGKGNQMAHAAALVVSEEPGTIYNPLFFYGGVGLGKTHLMHAIGHQYLEINPDANVKYVTSEKFANDFINSIQNKTSEQFRQEYRNVDMLLVDDIQFFANKEGTQEEFFHTFNALYDRHKQIVLTSDRLPKEIPKLQERLVSRFAWGLSVDITPPDLETRIAILRKKASAENLEIPSETLSYIAGQIDSNIRELEGALVRVQAYSAMTGSDITTSLAADALKSMIRAEDKELSIKDIQQTIAKYFQISVSDIKGKKRVKEIVVPRQIAMYLSRELTSLSFPKIADQFGGKDHTTVLHAHEKISKLLEQDQDYQLMINEIKEQL